LDEEVSNDGTYPPAAVAATTTTTTTSSSAASAASSSSAASASLLSAQLYQPNVLVVEGQPAHHGLASISNPCTFRNSDEKGDFDEDISPCY
jgi:hypothetical protein